MVVTGAKYFDYLDEYGKALQDRLGPEVDVFKINVWRRNGLEDLNAVTTGCRNLVEHALVALSGNDSDVRRADLKGKIEICEDLGLLNNGIVHKLTEIRRSGNRGAHSCLKLIEAQTTLELLDDFFRYLLRTWGIATDISVSAERNLSQLFYGYSAQEAEKLNYKAKTAALISGDDHIEKEVLKATKRAVKEAEKQEGKAEQLNLLFRQMEALSDSIEDNRMDTTTFYDKGDEIADKLIAAQRVANSEIKAVELEVDEILSEADFIHKLLKADNIQGQATDAQFEVMAFPRTQGAVTNTLMLTGGAGTGKTLCLLAKLISDVSTGPQLDLGGVEKKSALFLCFNKGLAKYVRSLLTKYPLDGLNIEVSHFDAFVNQLVKATSNGDFKHLAPYAKNVRYPASPEWKIIYGKDLRAYVEQAMKTAAGKHPERRAEYYLDTSSSDNVYWVINELKWLDSRYESPSQAIADYPTAARVGRGSKRRQDAEIRQIVLEIWETFNSLLEQNHRYTIDQAVKRLVKADSLPHYDSIAIDEVQDFTVASVRLVLQFRKSDKSRVYLSGDENQKIYQRDFTWKEVGENVRGHTITLKENKRNSDAVKRFAERLNGKTCHKAACSNLIFVGKRDSEGLVKLIKTVVDKDHMQGKTAVIGNKNKIEKLLSQAGISHLDASLGDITRPGVYQVGEFAGKGLEFDNVIVDYDRMIGADDEAEQRLRYVHFTRARKRLYICYSGEPPKLLKDYYGDFLD